MKIGDLVDTIDGERGYINSIGRITETDWLALYVNDKWYVSWQLKLAQPPNPLIQRLALLESYSLSFWWQVLYAEPKPRTTGFGRMGGG